MNLIYIPPVLVLITALVAINKNTWNPNGEGIHKVTFAGWILAILACLGFVTSEFIIYRTRMTADKYAAELKETLGKIESDIRNQVLSTRLEHIMIDVPFALLKYDGRMVLSFEEGGAALELTTSKGHMCNAVDSITQNNITVYVASCTPGDRFIYHAVKIDKQHSIINPYKVHLEIGFAEPFTISGDGSQFHISHPIIEVDSLKEHENVISRGTIYGCPNWLILNKSEKKKYILCGYEKVLRESYPKVEVLSLIYRKNA